MIDSYCRAELAPDTRRLGCVGATHEYSSRKRKQFTRDNAI